ncbi:hypothetical protein [Xanthomonas translucens]|uniref:Uncharacterized protein n=2 Tax=Xanthomonas translucens pv. translucens TaxID=134875 RepID=A0ABW9L0K6_XANCT|nr:hypothetical protein [Xanthomonas translucens]MCC8445534.1 hypothetical protein [Xanthomonas translucens pv. translucens]MCT8286480.1 hypothetical protein [Xanthomonas translucens pv. translucens]MCT8304138.1 hypothetical protein [Xanthomonas translucens pv. translucens]QSQ29236.1 hypothetical protein ISN30_12990 [Xanthomonas translucens pv. translucens]QSQ35268.1 hypothetical protein ISN31_06880 [Xanthomonas translucens pv. translucens]
MSRSIALRTLGADAANAAIDAAAAPRSRYTRLRRCSLWLLFAAFYLLQWLRLLAALLAAG